MREQKITVPGIAQPFIQTYTYDNLNRLESATETNNSTETWKQTFTIDRYGNRKFNTTGSNTTTLGSCPTAECNPEASASRNRFSTTDGYEYDANGSLIENAKGERFTYDMENHQTEFFDESNSGSTPDALYQYDGDGRRVKKIVGTEATIFVYNASGLLVAEYSTTIASVETAQVSYLTQDHLGSPRVITDKNGEVLSRKDYSAYGETLESDQHRGENDEYTDSSEVRKGYTGYEKDSESKLEFAQARYYNSVHGRFTSVDPLAASASIKNPQTFNRYSYVLNSPYKFVDPLGLISSSTGACGQWCQGNDGGMNGGGAFGSAVTGGYDSGWGNGWEEASLAREQHPTETGIVALHESVHEQIAQEPVPPPIDDLALLRAMFPIFNSGDQVTVDRAVADAAHVAESRGATNLAASLITGAFRGAGDKTTPEQAMNAIDTTTGVNIVNDSDGNQVVRMQNVFDGRTSTYQIDHDNDTSTGRITVAEYFSRTTTTVNAIVETGSGCGCIFLGPGFFRQDRVGMAKSMLHEAVVHKGFGRRDTDFGTTQVIGSRAINTKIDAAYRWYRP